MFNKIVNSPYTLAALLSVIDIVWRLLPSSLGAILGLIAPLLAVVCYTYFTKNVFSVTFKNLAVFIQCIFTLGLQELLFGTISGAIKDTGPHCNINILTTIITVFAVMYAVNYLYLFLGNKLGLWLLQKNK